MTGHGHETRTRESMSTLGIPGKPEKRTLSDGECGQQPIVRRGATFPEILGHFGTVGAKGQGCSPMVTKILVIKIRKLWKGRGHYDA